MDSIEKLLYLTGVAAEYLDYSGHLHNVPRPVRERVLSACGYDVANEQAIADAVFQLDAAQWQCWLRSLYIVDEDFSAGAAVDGVNMHCHPDLLGVPLRWCIVTEGGEEISGQVVPAAQPETGDYFIDGIRYSRRLLPLPALPLGYHQLQLADLQGREEAAQLVVCPQHCHQPFALTEKQWGVSCQLYTLRSQRNCGIGDFGDLKELIQRSAAKGADYIGLNPLHALCTDNADAASPYSPSDRRFFNALYIALDEVAEWGASSVQHYVTGADYGADVERLRAAAYVDYGAVSTLKYLCFELMFAEFQQHELAKRSQRAAQFTAFLTAQGEALGEFARYEAQHNPYPQRFADDPQFYCYLQWLAFTQLAECQTFASQAGMRMGLLGDLAVGSVMQGCEVKSNPDLFLASATIGAPPDPLGPSGQDWGLPVVNPVALKDSCFAHFIRLLRSNMTSYGALRVDHAMALMRLWWCLPEGDGHTRAGVYVYYPLNELLALLRLESVRNHCLIVGEDLGVVPEDFRAALQRSGIYSNNLLYFEQCYDQYFKPLQQHQPDALLMVTNHDVPTLCDWWNGSDIQRRFNLGLDAGVENSEAQLEHRHGEKQKLLIWLAEADLLPANRQQQDCTTAFDYPLCHAIHKACAATASALLLIQLEDLQLIDVPVNIPGTFREYPNWRRKQRMNTSEIFASPEALRVLESVSEERARERI